MKTENKKRILECVLTAALMTGIVLAGFSACKKKEPVPTKDVKTTEKSESQTASIEQRFDEQLSKKMPELATVFEKVKVDTSAHKKYLSEPLVFSELPKTDIPEGMGSAVVGSKLCLFYPNAKLTTNADLKNLPEGISIPFRTVLVIDQDVVGDTDEEGEYEGLFKFQDQLNYFYKAEWNGEKGLVFGADLVGVRNEPYVNQMISLLYANKGHFDTFYPMNGYTLLSQEKRDALTKNKLAFQNLNNREINYYSNFDDMIAMYTTHLPSDEDIYINTPIFITTDLIAHARHLVFDRALQTAEEDFFVPELYKLVDSFLKELDKVNTSGGLTAQKETLEKAKQYFFNRKSFDRACP